MDANQLSKVKLKKTVVSDKSAPMLTGFISEEAIDNYQKDVLQVNLESWIDLIADITFYTQLYPLSMEDAQTFIDAYDHWEKTKSQELPVSLQSKVDSIESGLQKVINAVKGSDEYVFVKTSSRSAKDTGIYQTRFLEKYRKFLSDRPSKQDNDKMVCLLQAGTEMLKIHNGREVLQTFCRSERVSQDMLLAMNQKQQFREHFVIRKWVDIDVDMEFRGFVHNNTLNALSQYNHLTYFPRLVEMREKIQNLITHFFEKEAKPRLEGTFSQYVIDFAITGPSFEKIWVIELNPFLPTTDGALFSWERERQILECGPFEFRLRNTVAHGAKALISIDWREVMEKYSDV